MQQRAPRTRRRRPPNPQTLPHCSYRFTKPRLAMGFCTQSQGQASIWPGAKLEPDETDPIQVGFLHLSSPFSPCNPTVGDLPDPTRRLLVKFTHPHVDQDEDSSELGDVQSKPPAHPAAQAWSHHVDLWGTWLKRPSKTAKDGQSHAEVSRTVLKISLNKRQREAHG